MALDKPYQDVPGTIIFDADQSRKGYWLNQFCMSLMKAENRERFKADERAYLDEWAMTDEQKRRCWRATSTGHAHRRQHLLPGQDRRHRRPELPADGRQHDRHDRAAVPRHDDRRRPQRRGQPLGRGRRCQARCRPRLEAWQAKSRQAGGRATAGGGQGTGGHARITASVYLARAAIGAAIDHGKTARLLAAMFAGYDFSAGSG